MRRCNDSEVVARRRAGHVRRASGRTRAGTAATGRSRAGCGASPSDGWSSRLRSRKDVVLLPEWDDRRRWGDVPAAEDEVLLGVEYGDLAGALRRLSPEFRSVVQAVVLDGLTTKEAGKLLGVRENTVKTRLHRAKAQLRGSLALPQEGSAMTTQTWHADDDLLAAYVAGAARRDRRRLGRAAPRAVRRVPRVHRRRWSTRCCSTAAWDAVRDTVESPRAPAAGPAGPALRAPGADRRAARRRPPRCARPGWSASFVALAFAAAGRHARRAASCSRRSSSSRRSCP